MEDPVKKSRCKPVFSEAPVKTSPEPVWTQITAAALIRYTLSFDIDAAIVGCSTPAEVSTLAQTGRMTRPLTEKDRGYLLNVFKPIARRLAYYRGAIG